MILASNVDTSTQKYKTVNFTVDTLKSFVTTDVDDGITSIVFEGSSSNEAETTLSVIDPTGDVTINLPDVSGTIPVLAAVSTTQITATPEDLNKMTGYLGSVTELNYLKELYDTGVTAAEYDILDGVTSTAAEINLLDGSIVGTVVNSKGVVYSAAGQVAATSIAATSAVFTGALENQGIFTTETIEAYNGNHVQIKRNDGSDAILKIANTHTGNALIMFDADDGDFDDNTDAYIIHKNATHNLEIGTNASSGNIVLKSKNSTAVTIDSANTTCAGTVTATYFHGDGSNLTGLPAASGGLPLTGGAMTGAITTNSTFDGVDIATRDGVLTSTTTTANAALPKAGGTMTGALTVGVDNTGYDVKLFGATTGKYMLWDESADSLIFPDDTHIVLGTSAGSKLDIYYSDSGTSTYIDYGDNCVMQGHGSLIIRTGNNGANYDIAILCTGDGGVDLNYNNQTKLATVASGVEVSGYVRASTFFKGTSDIGPGDGEDVDLNSTLSFFTTGGSGVTATLPDGASGQIKMLSFATTDGGGDMVITVTTAGWKATGSGTITFSDIGDGCTLMFTGAKWCIVGNNGCVFA